MNNPSSVRHSSLSDPGWSEGIQPSSARTSPFADTGVGEARNPYSAPQAALSDPVSADDTYQPSIFALKGRIGRIRYLAYSYLLFMLCAIVLGVLAAVLAGVFGRRSEAAMGIAGLLFYIPTTAAAIIMTVRRLHDLDRTGWLSILILVPFLNFFFALYLIFAGGTPQANRFGPRPVGNSWGLIIAGLLVPILATAGILAAVAIPAYQQYTMRAKNIQYQQQLPRN